MQVPGRYCIVPLFRSFVALGIFNRRLFILLAVYKERNDSSILGPSRFIVYSLFLDFHDTSRPYDPSFAR